jgi:hypothetical protein
VGIVRGTCERLLIKVAIRNHGRATSRRVKDRAATPVQVDLPEWFSATASQLLRRK